MDEFNLFFKVENNKIKLFLFIPFEYEENYDYDIDDFIYEPIYEETLENVDFNAITNKLKELLRVKNINYENIFKEKKLKINFDDTLDKESVYKFIKTNKDINFVIFSTDYKTLTNVLKNEDHPNVSIEFKNSSESVTYKEFKELFDYLNQIVDFINYYNLSPLEKTMLAYDIVKSNIYNEEKENESQKESRDLNRIIKNNKIVCVGFANLLDFILTSLGFKTGISTLNYENEEFGHERNYIYLKDNKYNINSIFFLDATWDSRRNDKYLDNYYYFLKPFRFFQCKTPNERQENLSMTKLLTKRSMLFESLKEKLKTKNIETRIVLKSLVNFLEEKEPIYIPFSSTDNYDFLEDVVKILEKKYYKSIEYEAFKNALYKVRKIEYINKIIDQMPSEDYIDRICLKFYKEQRLVAAIFGNDALPTLEKDIKETNACSINQDLLRAKLLRVLKETINDFPENDYIKKM